MFSCHCSGVHSSATWNVCGFRSHRVSPAKGLKKQSLAPYRGRSIIVSCSSSSSTRHGEANLVVPQDQSQSACSLRADEVERNQKKERIIHLALKNWPRVILPLHGKAAESLGVPMDKLHQADPNAVLSKQAQHNAKNGAARVFRNASRQFKRPGAPADAGQMAELCRCRKGHDSCQSCQVPSFAITSWQSFSLRYCLAATSRASRHWRAVHASGSHETLGVPHRHQPEHL